MKGRIFTPAAALLLMLMMSLTTQVQAQFTGCDATVPVHTVNLVGNPNGSFIFSDADRQDQCCDASNSDDCVHFILTLDSVTIAVSLNVVSGATPSGSLYYSVDCGTHTLVTVPICLNNPTHIIKTYDVVYCKPGGNSNTWSLNSIPGPSGFSASAAIGCRDTMKSAGYKAGTITWTSISPGTTGQYNGLLSCTTCANPVFTPTASSPSSIRYQICGKSNAQGICGVDSNTIYCDTVTATVLPIWSNVPDQSICQPATTASLGSASGATWSFVSGPATATIGASTGAITGLTANGTYTFVLTTTSGLCTDSVNVTRAGQPNAGSDQAICLPQTTAALGAAGGGTTWSFISGPVTATVNASTGDASGMTSAGNYLFKLSTGTCSDTVQVTIKPQPAAPTAGNNGPLCVGATLNLTASNIAGATYSWSGPSGFSTTTQNPSIVNVTTANAGTYTVTSIINACPSTNATTVVVINTIPSPPTVGSNSPVCESATINLTASGAGGATFSWTGPGGYTSSSATPSRTNATLAMAGSYCATQTVSGCTSSTACTTVVVNPKPTITSVLGTNPTTCGGTNGSISICGLVAGNVYTINYSKNGTPQSPVTNQTANGGGCVSITGLSAGTYTIFTVTLGSCTSDVFGGPDVVLTDPTTPSSPTVSSNSPVCEGDSLKLFATGSGGATYSWTGVSGSFTSTTQNPIRTPAAPSMSGSYCATQTVAGCTSPQACTNVTVNPKPVIGSAVGTNPTTCSGTDGFITLGGLSNNTSYQVNYEKNSSPVGPVPISSNGSGQVIITGLNAGTYSNFSVTNSSTGCVSVVFPGPVVLSNPSTPSAPTVSSNTPVCEDATLNLFATGAGGATFSWSHIADGFTSSLQNPTRPNATLSMAGSYCATQTVAGCTSPQACTSVTINPKPVIGGLSSSNPTTCSGADGCVFLNGLTANTQYTNVTYQKNNVNQGPFTLTTNGSGQLSICGLSAGTYDDFFVTLTGCVSDAFNGSITLTDPTNPAAPTVGSNTPVCVGNTILLTATGAGGATYSWTGPGFTSTQQNPSRANATAGMQGSYCVTQTVANCTSQPACTPVVISPLPVVDAGPDVSVCNGDCIRIGGSPTASSGTPGYTYAWSNGAVAAANPSVCPTTSTVYTVTVTDTRSCSASASALVTVNATPVADAGPDQSVVSCDLTGINIGGAPTASGGTGPYTYLWSPTTGINPGAVTSSNPQVSGLGSDQTYTVLVTDANGCTANDNVFVHAIAGSYSVVIVPNTSVSWCAETGGNITLTALAINGTSPYTYSWTGSDWIDSTGSGVTANPSIPESYIYSVVVTDATGCQAGDTIEITVFPTPVADAGLPDTVCSGFPVTLGGSPTASGGTPGYTYLWDNAAGSSANPVVNPTSSITYQVTVTDANGCTATDNKPVTVRANPTADAGPDVSISSCSPNGVTIGGSPAASGGTPGYTYNWNPTAFLTSSTAANPKVVGIQNTNTYTLVVSDTFGCTASDQVVVTVTSNTPTVAISGSAPMSWCANSGTSINLTATVSGGTAGFTYSWSGTSITPLNSQIAAVNPQAAGTYNYSVTITDAAGCTASTTKSVTVFSNPTASAGSSQSVCSGSPVTIGGSPTASGGGGGYSYSWSNGATTSNPSVSPTSTTIYTVTVTDANGCTASASVTITVKPLPTADAGPNVNLSSCSATGVTIGGSPTASGGNGPVYTYSWSPNTGLSSTTVANPVVQGSIPSGIYTVTITDAGGCTASDQVSVTVINNSPAVSISAGGATQWCAGSGGSTNLTANVSSGNPSFTYAWSGSSINPTNAATATVNPNTVGTFNYTVTVTDAANCTASAAFSITVNSNPTATASADQSVCNGTCATIGVTGSGGTPGYSYSWSNGNPGQSQSVCPLSTTTYVVTVTDSKTCSATAATTVIVNPQPVANAGADQTLINCNGDSAIIGGSPTAIGGSGSFTYLWSPTTGLSSSTASNPVVKGIASTTTYCVTVTDVNGGCTASDCVTISVSSSSLQAQAAASVSYCAGSVPSVNVGGIPTATGGTPPYVYSWSGAGLSATNVPNPTAPPASTTTYCVTVTDANGCSASSCMTITVTPLPTANAGNDTAVCFGSCVIIGGNPAGTGGTGSLNYVWTPGTGLNSSSIANPQACPGVTTSYGVTVTDSRGCSASDNMTIVVNPNPVADAGDDVAITTCSGDSVLLGGSPASSGGTGALTCLWSPPASLNDPNLCNPYFQTSTSGTFLLTLTVTDAAGCSSSDQVSVRVTTGNLQVDAGNDVSACADNVGNITLGGQDEVLGGEGPYTFAWSSTPVGFTSTASHPVVSPSVTTVYCLTVTDANGCTATDCMTVTVHQSPMANAGNDTTVCFGASVNLGGSPTASGGTPNYTFNWGPSIGINSTTFPNPTATPLGTTTYCVTVTDAAGCTAADCTTITVRQNPVADAGADQSMPACSGACVQIGGSPAGSGGGGILTCSWSPPGPPISDSSLCNPFVCNLGSTSTFVLTVIDQFGCSATDQVTIFVTNPSLAANAGNDVSFCAGSNICVTIGGVATGGTAPYNYAWSSIPPSIITQVFNPVVCPTVTTTYTVVVTDANGCIATDQVTVTVNPRPSVCPMRDLVICQGESTQLGCNPTAVGGTGPITYAWSPGTGLNCVNCGNPVATPLSTTTYCVTATDSLGCSASGCQTITVNPPPVADAGPDKTMTNCPGSFAIIGGSPSASGGSGNYTYQWTPCLAPPIMSSCTTPNPIITGLTNTTTFTLIVTDNLTGCTDSDQVTVIVNQSNLVANAGCDIIRCFNNAACTRLGGGTCGGPTASGGVGPYTYLWGPGIIPSQPNPCISPILSGTFCVTVTDALGCSAVDCMTLTLDPQLVANAGPDTLICTGASITIGGTPTAIGGTPPYNYIWNPVTGLSSNIAPNPTAQNVTACITYTVVVTDSLGCTSSPDNMQICVRPLPIVNAGPDAILVACTGDSAVLGGNPTVTGTQGPYTYLWSNLLPPDNTLPNPVTGNLGSNTTYTITGTDAFGCSASDFAVITVVPNTLFAHAGPDQSLCTANLHCVTLGDSPAATGGVPPYQYQWTGGTVTPPDSSNPSACPQATTNYTLIVTDSHNCSSTDQVNVTVNTSPVASFTGLNSQYCVNATNATMIGSPGGGVFSGVGVTGNSFNPFSAGVGGPYDISYAVCVGGCCDTTHQFVTVNPLPQVSVTGYLPSYCASERPDTLIGTPSGGTFTPQGNGLTDSIFDPSVASVGPHLITYTYTDPQTGCTNTSTVTITVKTSPTITVTPSADTICKGGSSILCPNYSIDVTNIQWTAVIGGNNLGAGLNCQTITPPLSAVDYCVKAKATNQGGCIDSAIVCIHVNQPPVAGNDSTATCEEQPVLIDILTNDTDPEGDCMALSILSLGGLGDSTTTLTGGVLNFVPMKDKNGLDTLMYLNCNCQCPNQCDTGFVFISVCPINDTPSVAPVVASTCRDSSVTVTLNITDPDVASNHDSLTITNLACAPLNGIITGLTVSGFTYTPSPGFVGTQIICIQACDTSNACDVDTVTITVNPCNNKPNAVDDAAQEQLCDYDTLNIKALTNDTDPDGDVLKVVQVFGLGQGQGTATFADSTTVTYIPGTALGTITFSYVISDNGNPSLRDTATITIDVIDCITEITPVADTVCRDETSRTCVSANVSSTFPWTITTLCQPQHGTAVVSSDPQCFNYTPAQGFVGNDTFCITICDDRGHCDDTTVVITILDCTITAVDDACDVNETPLNTPINVDVLANDILPQGTETIVTVVCPVSTGTAVPDPVTNTILVTPPAGFEGEITFCYQVCVVSGSHSVCDSASVCVTVKDTTCYIPNAFSPNGDGQNDLFVIPCNEDNEKATLRIFDRWGVEVWYSNGHYLDDFAGKNMQGTELPDGTYYLIYDYNNGTNKREAKFVVIQR